MSKWLDITGLSAFWAAVRKWLEDNLSTINGVSLLNGDNIVISSAVVFSVTNTLTIKKTSGGSTVYAFCSLTAGGVKIEATNMGDLSVTPIDGMTYEGYSDQSYMRTLTFAVDADAEPDGLISVALTYQGESYVEYITVTTTQDGESGDSGIALTCTPITVKKSSSQQTVYSYLTMTDGAVSVSPGDISVYVTSTPTSMSYVQSAAATLYVRLSFTVNAGAEPSGVIQVEAGYNGTYYTGIIAVTTVADGEDGADGADGEDGKDGADGADGEDGITLVYSNNPMQFVLGTTGQATSSSQSCTVTVYKGGAYYIPSITVTDSSGCDSYSVSGNTVTLSPARRVYIDSDGTQHQVYYTAGYVDITATYDGESYTGRISYTCDSSASWYQFYATDGLFQSLQSSVTSLDGALTEAQSAIEQTANEISLTVQENTYDGNLLTGTKFQSDDGLLRSYSADTTIYYSTSYPDEVGAHVYVDPDGGYGSTSVGSLRMTATSSESLSYIGVLWTDVGDLTAGTTYYFSAWVKKNSAITLGSGFAFQVKDNSNANVTAYYNGTSATSGYVNSQVSTYDTWTLVTMTWKCDSDIESAIVRFWLRNYGDVEISRVYFGTDESASWCLSEGEVVDYNTLLATGIDIVNQQITLTSNTVIIQDNSGDAIASFTSGGSLETGAVSCTGVDDDGNEYLNVEIGSREGTDDQGEIRIYDYGILRVKLNSDGLYFLDSSGNVTGSYLADGSSASSGVLVATSIALCTSTALAYTSTGTLTGSSTYYLLNGKMYTNSGCTTLASSGAYFTPKAIAMSNSDGSVYYIRYKYTVSSTGTYTKTTISIGAVQYVTTVDTATT